jgi:hypothetical protein
MLSSFIINDVFGIKSPLYSWHPKQVLDSAIALPFFRAQSGVSALSIRETYFHNLGRDSMLMAGDIESIFDLKIAWHDHFLKHTLSQPMMTPKGSKLMEILRTYNV